MVLKQVLSDLTVDFPPLELLSCKIPCDINVMCSVREEGKGTEGVASRQGELGHIGIALTDF